MISVECCSVNHAANANIVQVGKSVVYSTRDVRCSPVGLQQL